MFLEDALKKIDKLDKEVYRLRVALREITLLVEADPGKRAEGMKAIANRALFGR